MDNTENKDFVVCLAGYRDLMTKMLNANLNLMSRMGNWIDFPDYDDNELLQISELYGMSPACLLYCHRISNELV